MDGVDVVGAGGNRPGIRERQTAAFFRPNGFDRRLAGGRAERLVGRPAHEGEDDVSGDEARGNVAIGRRDPFGLLGQILQPVRHRREMVFRHFRGVEAEHAGGLTIGAERIVGHADLALVFGVKEDIVGGGCLGDDSGIVADADGAPVRRHARPRAVGIDPDVLHVRREERQQVLQVWNLRFVDWSQDLQALVEFFVGRSIGDEIEARATTAEDLGLDVVMGAHVGGLDLDAMGFPPRLHLLGKVVAFPRHEVDDAARVRNLRRGGKERRRPGRGNQGDAALAQQSAPAEAAWPQCAQQYLRIGVPPDPRGRILPVCVHRLLPFLQFVFFVSAAGSRSAVSPASLVLDDDLVDPAEREIARNPLSRLGVARGEGVDQRHVAVGLVAVELE
jgi:hypothetical protein